MAEVELNLAKAELLIVLAQVLELHAAVEAPVVAELPRCIQASVSAPENIQLVGMTAQGGGAFSGHGDRLSPGRAAVQQPDGQPARQVYPEAIAARKFQGRAKAKAPEVRFVSVAFQDGGGKERSGGTDGGAADHKTRAVESALARGGGRGGAGSIGVGIRHPREVSAKATAQIQRNGQAIHRAFQAVTQVMPVFLDPQLPVVGQFRADIRLAPRRAAGRKSGRGAAVEQNVIARNLAGVVITPIQV